MNTLGLRRKTNTFGLLLPGWFYTPLDGVLEIFFVQPISVVTETLNYIRQSWYTEPQMTVNPAFHPPLQQGVDTYCVIDGELKGHQAILSTRDEKAVIEESTDNKPVLATEIDL